MIERWCYMDIREGILEEKEKRVMWKCVWRIDIPDNSDNCDIISEKRDWACSIKYLQSLLRLDK